MGRVWGCGVVLMGKGEGWDGTREVRGVDGCGSGGGDELAVCGGMGFFWEGGGGDGGGSEVGRVVGGWRLGCGDLQVNGLGLSFGFGWVGMGLVFGLWIGCWDGVLCG